MKKILVLVMSCQDEFFVNEENIGKETWAKDIIDGKYDNITYLAYRGGYDKNSISKKENVLKLNVEDDISHTFKKTYFALSMIKKNIGEFDYVFRTNTSTYVNVELLNEFIQNIKDDSCIYGSDVYSLSEIPAPYPLCLIARGNGMILSKRNIDIILQEGIMFLNREEYDDIAINTIMNSYWIKQGKDYKNYIKSFYHGWYKCVKNNVNNGHGLCIYGNDSTDYSFWKDFITIQIRNYGDLQSFKFRIGEEKKFYELYEVFKDKKNENIEESVNKNIIRSSNYEIFIGSILGYIKYKDWLNSDKMKLYVYEKSNKAADDPEKFKNDKRPFIYVDYFDNKTGNILI